MAASAAAAAADATNLPQVVLYLGPPRSEQSDKGVRGTGETLLLSPVILRFLASSLPAAGGATAVGGHGCCDVTWLLRARLRSLLRN